MSFSELILNEDREPLCNQPVPLRLVPLITDWSCCFTIDLLFNGIELQRGRILPLVAYVCNDETISRKPLRRAEHRRTHRKVHSSNSEIEQFNCLPANHIVYSDDLLSAFTDVINSYTDRDTAYADGMGLNWSPNTKEIIELLQDCPDTQSLLPPQLDRHARKHLRDQNICRRAEFLADSNNERYYLGPTDKRRPNILEIVRQIKRDDVAEGLGEESIKKIITPHLKKRPQ